MQNYSRPLPCELIMEISKWIPLKIFTTKCVKPTNSALLLTNSVLNIFLRPRIEAMKQIIKKLAAGDDVEKLDNIVSSLDDLRMICLGKIACNCFYLVFKSAATDFQAHSFVNALTNFVMSSPNPHETMVNEALIKFSYPFESNPMTCARLWSHRKSNYLYEIVLLPDDESKEEEGRRNMKIHFKMEKIGSRSQ